MVVMSDLLILIVTWMKTADIVSVKIKNFRPKLSTLLIRNGTLYFIALLVPTQ